MPKYEHQLVSSSTVTDLEKKLEPLGAEGWHAINFAAIHMPHPSGSAGGGSAALFVLLERETPAAPL